MWEGAVGELYRTNCGSWKVFAYLSKGWAEKGGRVGGRKFSGGIADGQMVRSNGFNEG